MPDLFLDRISSQIYFFSSKTANNPPNIWRCRKDGVSLRRELRTEAENNPITQTNAENK